VRTVCMRTHMVDRTYTALWGLDRHNQSSQLPYLKLCGNAATTDQLCLSINEVNVLQQIISYFVAECDMLWVSGWLQVAE
jgi:hypothetical protein